MKKTKASITVLSVLQAVAVVLLLLSILDVKLLYNALNNFVLFSILSIWVGPMFAMLFYAYIKELRAFDKSKLTLMLIYAISITIIFIAVNTVKVITLNNSLWWIIFVYIITALIGFITFVISKNYINEHKSLALAIAIPAIIAGIFIILMLWTGYYFLGGSSSKSPSSSGKEGSNDNHYYVHYEDDYSVNLLNGPTLKKDYAGRWIDDSGKEWKRDTSFGTNSFKRK